MTGDILLHASCVARQGAGVLLLGPSGSGKSDLALRLMDRGFDLVADDQVVVRDGIACAAPNLAGLLEVRGLGIVRRPALGRARLALVVRMDAGERLPHPETDPVLGLPCVHVLAAACSAPERVGLALDCALGRASQLAGAFA
jgi:HPr kinase/phosphorylase